MDVGPSSSRRDLLRSAGGIAALPDFGFLDGSQDPTPRVEWTARVDTDSFLAPIETGHGAVYAVTEEQLVAISRETGRTNWTRGYGAEFAFPAEVLPSTLFVQTGRPDRLLAVDPADGAVLWQAEDVTHAFVRGDVVYAVGEEVSTLSATDGTPRWSVDFAGEPYWPIFERESLFVGTDQGALYAVDHTDGTPLWRLELPTVGDDGWVKPVGVGGHLEAGGGGAEGADSSAVPRTVFVWNRGSNSLHAVSASDGRERWTYSVEESTPVFSPVEVGEDAVYVADGRTLVSVAVADGSENWRLETGFDLHVWGTPKWDTDLVLAADYDTVYAVSKTDGTLVWRFENEDQGRFSAYDVVLDGILVATTEPENEDVYRLEAADGRPRWRFGCDCDTSNVVGDGTGPTYVGTEDGRLFALTDPEFGPLATVTDAATRLGPAGLVAGLVAGGAVVGATRLLRSGEESSPDATDEAPLQTPDWTLDDLEPREPLSTTPYTERVAAAVPDRDDPVALTRLRPDARDDRELVSAFESGVETVAGLDVDGVPDVVVFGTATEPWLATEFWNGESLAARTDDLSTPGILDAVASAARTVQAAHERGVTHGRLSPESIRIAPGEPSAVRVVGWELRALPLGDEAGADPFAAPEQLKPGRSAQPELTDVYRLGAVAYHAVSGRPPFGPDPGPRDFETSPTPPTALDPDLPAKLDVRLDRALSVQPSDRYESADAFADALRYGVPRE